MDKTNLSFWMSVVDILFWGICFRWMHQISSNQNRVLAQLQEQGKRIERFSKIEHDLIKEVHPQVGEIKSGMEEMIAAVKERTESTPPRE